MAIIDRVPALQDAKNASRKLVGGAVGKVQKYGVDAVRSNTVGLVGNAVDSVFDSSGVNKFKNEAAKFLNSGIANDILGIVGDLERFDGHTTMDLSCKAIRDKIAMNEEDIYQDSKLIDKLLVDREKNGEDSRSAFVLLTEITENLQTVLDKMNKSVNGQLESILNMFGGITEGYDPTVLLAAAINELLSLLEPFLEIPGLPDIPFIGDIKEFFKTLAKVGEMASALNNDTSIENSNKRGETEYGIADDSLIWKILDQILSLIVYFFNTVVPFIIQYVQISFILEFLNTIKPVIDYFGLTLGPFAKLIMTIPNIFSIELGFILGGKSAIVNLFEKTFSPLYYALYAMINPSNASINDKLKYLLRDKHEKMHLNELYDKQIVDLECKNAISAANKNLTELEDKRSGHDGIIGWEANIANLPAFALGGVASLGKTVVNSTQDFLNNSWSPNLSSNYIEKNKSKDGVSEADISAVKKYISDQEYLLSMNNSTLSALSEQYNIESDGFLGTYNYTLIPGSKIDNAITSAVNAFMSELPPVQEKESAKTDESTDESTDE